MALIAAADTWQADHLVDLPSPEFAVESHLAGAPNARVLFHYQAEEEKRRNYEAWEMAQIVLGSLFFLFLLFGTDESKVAILAGLALLLLVLSQRFFLFPNIASLGRELDFLPAAVPSPSRGKLAALLGFYGGVEIAKWSIQLFMAGRVIAGRRRPESEGFRNYVNPINKANYRHVNR
ncbi:MAG TPA: hypothetical protein VME43_26785 [Bryobacteraceae bacterium]|nr:hypothetical protein [Bryobacteraceae bacterium]